MIPTDHEVYNQARALLGEVPSGTRPSNATLHPYLNIGYQRLYSKLKSLGSPLTEGEGYGYISAQQSRLPLGVSQDASINAYSVYTPGLGFIKEVWERKGVSMMEPNTITVLTGFNAIRVVTAFAHNLVDGDRVELFGVIGFYPDINGSWTVDVESPTQFQIRGCYTLGTMTTSGHIIHSKAEWLGPLEPKDRVRDIPTTPQSTLGCYCFQGGYLHFPPQSGEPGYSAYATEIKIIYSFSGTLPAPGVTAQTTRIDDSLNYLSHFTVASFLNAKGVKGTAQSQFGLAEEALVDLLRPQVRQLQLGEPTVMPPFRGPRSYRSEIV